MRWKKSGAKSDEKYDVEHHAFEAYAGTMSITRMRRTDRAEWSGWSIIGRSNSDDDRKFWTFCVQEVEASPVDAKILALEMYLRFSTVPVAPHQKRQRVAR